MKVMNKKLIRRKAKNLSIGKVELGRVPRIAAVIRGPQLVELAVRAREDGADILEVRVDLFQKVNLVGLKKLQIVLDWLRKHAPTSILLISIMMIIPISFYTRENQIVTAGIT